MTLSLETINIAISAAGLLVCILGLLMAVTGSTPEKRTKHYFIAFFSLLVAYVACNLIGQLGGGLDGMKLPLFLESAFSSVLTLLLTAFLLDQSGETGWPRSAAFRIAAGLWIVYMALLIYAQFSTAIYYYDAQDGYHRGAYYPLLLVPPLCIMLLDLFVLWRRRKRFTKRQIAAFAVYILLPMLTMLVQMMFFGLYVIVLGTAVAALFMFLYILRDQSERFAKQQAENAQLRVDVMLSQIQPHFLYNSLGAIRDTYRGDARRGEQAITEFAEYLRHNMDSLTEDQPIPLTEELKHVRCYLDLQKLRFGDDLNVAYDLECTDFLLPTLTLQPLVENAVTYGVRKSETGRGTVTIRSREYPDRWELGVIDDGPGFVPDSLPGDSERSHIGLRNVRERLQRACGGELRIDSVLGEGTTVTIILPREGT